MKKFFTYHKKVALLLLVTMFSITSIDSFAQRFLQTAVQEEVNPDYPADRNFENYTLNGDAKSPSSNTDYFWKNPVTSGVTIADLGFADNNLIYAVGQFGTVMKSTDGGESWGVLETPFSESLTSIEVLSATELWVVGSNGFVASSNDAGLTWDIKNTGSTIAINAIALKDVNTIYACGASKTLLKSVDGGTTWAPVVIPNTTLVNPHNKTAWVYKDVKTNGSNVWLTVDGAGIPFQVLRSTDDGATWTSSVASGLSTPGSSTGVGVTAIDFNSDFTIGYGAYRTGLGGGLIKTFNSGETWENVANLNLFTPLPAPNVPYSTQTVQIKYDVAVSNDGNTVISSGLFGQVLSTTDGGATWSEIYGGVRQGDRDFFAMGFNSVKIFPNGSGWLTSGTRGVIAGAGNFDAAQAEVKAGAEKQETFTDMVFLNENTALAVGFQNAQKFLNEAGDFIQLAIGSYYRTEDGGQTWERQVGPGMSGYRWYSIESNGEGDVWLSGMKLINESVIGVIVHSADNGQTWEEKFALPGEEIGFLKRFDQNFYAATFSNLFISSSDGNTWQTFSLTGIVTPENPINALEVTAPKTVFLGGGYTLAGGKGFVIKTEDGGATWNLVFDSGTTAGRISDISFIDARFGFASGTWGSFSSKKSLIYTSNYGESWTPVAGTFDGVNSAELTSIAMIDSLNAIIYGASGQAVNAHGTDDFAPRLPRFTASSIYNVEVNSANQAFVLGENSAIVEFNPVETLNTAPGKFANQYPAWGDVLMLNSQTQLITWTESIDPDVQTVSYEWILEDAEGASVILRLPAGENNSLEITAETFSGIAQGQYRWRVEATDPQGLYSTTYPTPVEIQFSSVEYYTVTFNIEDNDGNAINDAVITFNEQVLAQGQYVIEDLLPGTYSYAVAKGGYESVTGEVTVVDADVLVDVILVEEAPLVYSVTFDIKDEAGITVNDAVVTFNEQVLAQGQYVIEDLLPGTYSYVVANEGYESVTDEVTVVNADVLVDVILIETTPPLYSVTFQILDEEGATVDDAIITFNGISLPANVYQIQDIAPGIYDYDVQKDGYYTFDGTIVVFNENMIMQVVMETDVTSVSDLESEQLHVFPNPASEILYIESPQTEIYIYDYAGKIVYEGKSTGEIHKVDVSNYNSGIYIVRILVDNKFITRKLQVQ